MNIFEGRVDIRLSGNPILNTGIGETLGEVGRTELSSISVKALIRHLKNPCSEKGMHTRSFILHNMKGTPCQPFGTDQHGGDNGIE